METEFIEAAEVVTNNMQIYQQDKAIVDMQISTAKRYPRNLRASIDKAITIATLDVETATSCMFSLVKGGKTIKGPSVHLAKIIAQSFGNMRIDNRVVGFDDTHVTCEATCFDLESNFAVRTQIKRAITGNSGRFSEDMCVIIGNAGNSIALRNAVFAVVDKSIINKVYKAAIQVITGDISDETKFTAKKISILSGFKDAYAEQKLTDIEVCRAVNKESVQNLTPEDLVVLMGFQNSLKSGEQKFESIFRPSAGSYVAPPSSKNKETERFATLLERATTMEQLKKLATAAVSTEERVAYDNKFKQLNTKK